MMRIGLYLLLCFLTTVSLASPEQEGQTVVKKSKEGSFITFLTRRIDVGTVNSPWKITVVYEFSNTGDTPLVIENVTTDCGCTVAEFTHKRVKPGKKGFVKVTYDGEFSEVGYFHKTINVVTNSWRKPVERLYLEGERGE